MNIRKNTANTVVIPLSQNQSSSVHDWLFEFRNETTGDIKRCIAEDISLFPARYNEFIITDSETEDPYNGTLNFSPTGSWTYKAYEMPITSPPSLDPANALKLVREDIFQVYDPNENTNVTFDTDEGKSNVVFDEP